MNWLLDHLCLFIFNKKAKKESIIENVNVTSNIKEYTAIIDNKRVCLGNTEEYLYETIDDKQANINNKEYEKVLVDLLSIHQYILKSINKMYIQTKNKKINNNVNKNSSKKAIKKSDLNNSAKKSIKHNNANKRINNNNANKKITTDNSANKKIASNNSANKNITTDNNANTNIIRKRKNNVNIVNGENICNNNAIKLKQD